MSVSEAEIADRLARLEAAVAHLERTCDAFNAVVTGHSRQLDRMERQLERMGTTLAAEEIERIRQRNVHPPHSTGR